MNVPKGCDAWAQVLESGTPTEQQIIENLREDPCVDDRVTGEFFSRLAVAGSPADAEEAIKFAHGVVQGDVDLFTCTGREVPDNTFVTLFRIDHVQGLRYRVPDALDALGLSDAELAADDVSEDDLRAVTDDYDGPVNLGNELQIVWVTDHKDVFPSLDSLQSVCDAVGLPNASRADKCVICVYKRGDTGTTLHVPRVLDGIAISEFSPNTDCDADTGRTRPLTGPPEDGMPEAVHRSCVVVPDCWELRTDE